MHHLTRPQGRITYDLYGAGNTGPLVVCVPGMFDHRHSFRFVGAGLAEAGYRVAVMDLRGHGDSDTTFDDHTSRAAATDVLALAEELGGEDVVIVGNSLGAGAAAIAAKDRPGTVSDAGGMRARAVVVMGELDPDWKDPRAQAERVASVVGGSVLMVPECGHYAHAQRPDVVVPAVEALLQEVVTGA
ncbi:alpha/beta fold hydrolase [Nocardiopsis akebiae]|uniref:Alpha/beta fold hydrolase n=1 Tax=Nocardiopsis akebiae TaxID=2831968 RepID=A0ABX8C8X5_9ACTN|nr:alpha/beta fold hydrolase [Nocardiopsis akebiae]QUX30857.1 alpha/beta fold hydrolase [Nocardiopsis akebiae]